jgi:hypothetical protein
MNAAGKPVSKKVLLSIPTASTAQFVLTWSSLASPRESTLHELSEQLEFACSPNAGLVSLVVATGDGKTA